MKKILEVIIKTIDDKNHVRVFNKNDVDLESITFKEDCTETKNTPKKPVTADKPAEKDTKKTGKKDSKK